MDDWINEFGAALKERLGRPEGELRVEGEAARALLDLAGAVAHGTGDRTNAPLSTFLAGCFVQARAAEGVPVPEAIREASELASTLLPPEP
jgi:hypothetical protein